MDVGDYLSLSSSCLSLSLSSAYSISGVTDVLGTRYSFSRFFINSALICPILILILSNISAGLSQLFLIALLWYAVPFSAILLQGEYISRFCQSTLDSNNVGILDPFHTYSCSSCRLILLAEIQELASAEAAGYGP